MSVQVIPQSVHNDTKGSSIYYVSTLLGILDPLQPFITINIVCTETKQNLSFFAPSPFMLKIERRLCIKSNQKLAFYKPNPFPKSDYVIHGWYLTPSFSSIRASRKSLSLAVNFSIKVSDPELPWVFNPSKIFFTKVLVV